MNNLADAGLVLRTLELVDYAQLVSDLNYNFQQLISMPSFKGRTGDAGAAVTGPAGQRGSNWIFTSLTLFSAEYSEITSNAQITLSVLNTKAALSITDLKQALGIANIYNGDLVVLPNGEVVQYVSGSNSFVATTLVFSNATSLSEARVIELINSVLSNSSVADEIYKLYTGVAKNYSDVGLGLNIELNTSSAVDIDVSSALAGVDLSDYLIVASKESYLSSQKSMFLTGAAERYHLLVQGTLTNDTVDYAPGIDDFPAITVLQNDYRSGIKLGFRDETSFRKFANIYRTANLLRITASSETNILNMSRLDLSNSLAYLYAPINVELKADSGIRLTAPRIEHKYLTTDTTTDFGHDTDAVRLNLRYPSIYVYSSVLTSNADILSLVDNQLVKTFSVPTTISTSANDLVRMSLLSAELDTINNTLDQHDVDITALQLASASGYAQRTKLTSGNLNTMTAMGQYKLYAEVGSSFSNLPNGDLNQHISSIQSMYPREADVMTFRYVDGTMISLTQIYASTYTNVNSSSQSNKVYIRCAESTNTGATYTWTNWQRFVLSDFAVIGERCIDSDTDLSNENSGAPQLTIRHSLTGVSPLTPGGSPLITPGNVGNGNLQYFSIAQITLDECGHPINAVINDLRSWVYSKSQIDAMLAVLVPTGIVVEWSGPIDDIPDGWLLCNAANHASNPAIPNKEGLFTVGIKPSDAAFASMGQTGGAKTVTLQITEMPVHSHGFSPSDGRLVKIPVPGTNGTVASVDTNNTTGTEPDLLRSYPLTITADGGGQPHENLPPYVVGAFIWKS